MAIAGFGKIPGNQPPYANEYQGDADWKPYRRDAESLFAIGLFRMEGFEHRVGGLEKDYNTSANLPIRKIIKMLNTQAKIDGSQIISLNWK
jgi:2-oxoglutarate ferredoxin oxidoreductase subunit alpha